MSQQNRILKHCQRLSVELGLDSNTKGDVHKSGAIFNEILIELDIVREVRRLITENPNDASLGKEVRLLLNK
jgi:hypothetical protein